MPAYLESIVAAHRAGAANDPRDVEAVIEAAVEAAGQALREAARPATAQAGAEPGAAGAQAQSGARSPAQSGAQSGQSGAQSGEPGALRSFVGRHPGHVRPRWHGRHLRDQASLAVQG